MSDKSQQEQMLDLGFTFIKSVPLALKIKRVPDCTLPIPAYQSEGASGFDLCANLDRSIQLGPGNNYHIGCGFLFEVPPGFELQIRPRSGLAFKHMVMTSLGTIDADYRGEVKLNMMNLSRWRDYVISPGDRIAQAVLTPVVKAVIEEVEQLSPTKRGTAGFGSSGV